MAKKTSKKIALIKTRYGSYHAVFKPESDMGGYVVTVPKVQGVVSWGKNLAEAKRMVIEATEGIIELGVVVEAEKRGEVRFVHQRLRATAFA